MPTDLPPDYKPKPLNDPSAPSIPGSAPDEDARDSPAVEPQPGADVVDPPGWASPPSVPGGDPVPLPAGMPTF